MANFIPGWNFRPASETNPLKTKLSITWRGIQPGAQFSPAKRAWKSESVSCNRNGILAPAEKGTQACALTVFSHLSKLCVLRPGWNLACNHNNISARWAERNFSPGWNSPCNRALNVSQVVSWNFMRACIERIETRIMARLRNKW